MHVTADEDGRRFGVRRITVTGAAESAGKRFAPAGGAAAAAFHDTAGRVG
ncbi:hypothetical protein GCM10018779_23500 [Streptomyces griseocarneus]|nr:hypothetical protein GCM10018779_23500 [Streptomyces griseocarneus]